MGSPPSREGSRQGIADSDADKPKLTCGWILSIMVYQE